MTCKDCVHYEVCKDDVELYHDSYDCLEVDGVEKHCEYFKPKSRFMELPNDEFIMFVKDNWFMLNVEHEDLGKAIKACVDYLTKNAQERERE